MEFAKLLLLFTLISIVPGQIVRVPIFQTVTVTVSDIAVTLCVFFSSIYLLFFKRSLKLKANIIIPAFIFSLIAFASTVLALQNFSKSEVATAALFLIRFLLYFAISVITFNLIEKQDVKKWINGLLLVITVFVFLGFFQLIAFPDLTFLTQFGWDPHLTRITSTFLDPNFAGGLMSISFALSLAFYTREKKFILLLVSGIIFIAAILTFSRSTYLAFLTVLATIGILKSPRLLLAFLGIFLIAFFSVPQVKTRVAGALSVDETAQARLESWEKAIVIFQKNPVFGVGFNTYRYAQEKEGFFSIDDPLGGHSGAGSDSSVLLVAATTGTIGLFAFIYFLFAQVLTFAKGARRNALHLGALSAFLSLIVHSQFVNSLFFPQIMLVLWFILGLVNSYDS